MSNITGKGNCPLCDNNPCTCDISNLTDYDTLEDFYGGEDEEEQEWEDEDII